MGSAEASGPGTRELTEGQTGQAAALRLEITTDGEPTKEVRERRFVFRRGSREIPGLLWTPAGADGPRPLVLACHGAGGNKRQPYVVSFARRLVRHHLFAVVAIDGPVHGDRRTDGSEDSAVTLIDFAQVWASDPAMIDDMVADWRAAIDVICVLDDVGAGPVGWWGLSMGTILGVPLLAAEARIEVAVLGLMGALGPTAQARERTVSDAHDVRCPVLFLMQWDDELMRREDVLSLFAEIGSSDKRLHAQPGRHADVPAEELDASERFLAQHLVH